MQESQEEQLYAKLDISCPNCNEVNTVNLSSEIKCKKCEKSLTQWKYNKFKKPIIGTFTALMIGGIAGQNIDDYFSKTRYPIAVEYTIIHNCISSYQEPLQGLYYRQKTKVCICALSKTMKIFDYSDYKKDSDKFLNIFEKKADECP